jgi:O-antigen ligase
MNSTVATAAFLVGMAGLFFLDRDSRARLSSALWVPTLWLAIGGSRLVSQWLNPTQPGSGSSYVEGNALDRNILTGLICCGLLVLVTRRATTSRILRNSPAVLCFFAYCLVSLVWSDFAGVAFRRWVKALGDLVMVLVILSDPAGPRAIQRVLSRVCFILIPTSILLMKYYPDLARGFDEWTFSAVYSGVATSKNSLGMICMIFGLGCLWAFLEAYREDQGARRIGRLIAHGVVLLMMAWLLVGADSMTSLACLVIAVVLIATTKLGWVVRTRSVVHLLVGSLVLVAFAVLFLGLGERLLEAIGRDASLTGRADIWPLVLAMVTNPVFGAGFESFWLGDRLDTMWSTHRGINQAHNGYLEIYLNLGWVGLLLLAGVCLSGYARIVAALASDRYAARFRLAYFVAVLVYNFTEGAFKMMSPVWVVFLTSVMAPATGVTSDASLPSAVEPLAARRWQLQRHRPASPQPSGISARTPRRRVDVARSRPLN